MQYFAGRLYQKRKRLVKDNTMSKISSWSYLCKKKLQGEKRWPSSKQPIVRDLLNYKYIKYLFSIFHTLLLKTNGEEIK